MKITRVFAWPILFIMFVGCVCLITTGCPSQNQTAALVGVAGTAIASLETIEGHTDAAAKIQVDFSAAQTAVLNWKAGTPTQDVAQALQIVIGDLNLLPVSEKDKAYVILASGTVQAVLDLFPSGPAQPNSVAHARADASTPAPKNAEDFKLQWNALPGHLAPLK